MRGIKHLFEALYKTQRYEDIVKLILELDATPALLESTSLLLDFIQGQHNEYYNVSFLDKRGELLRVIHDPSLTVLFQKALDLAAILDSGKIAEDRRVWLADQVAEWKYHHGNQPEDPIWIWEKLVNLIDRSSEVNQQSKASYRTNAAEFLSMAYFNAAKDVIDSREDPQPHIKKLEALAKHKQGSKSYYRAANPARLLGFWLRKYAKAPAEE